MNKDLINKYISIPLAIKVLKQDKDKFKDFKLGYLYQDLIDSAIKTMEKDFYMLRGKMYHEVRQIEGTKYRVKDEVIDFTPRELKEITTQTIKEYFKGPVEWKEHIWKK